MDAIQYIQFVRERGGLDALRLMPNVRVFSDNDDLGALMTELSQDTSSPQVWTHIPTGIRGRDDPFGQFGVIAVNVRPEASLNLIIGSMYYADADGETHFSDFDWLRMAADGSVTWGRNGQEFRGHRVVSVQMMDGG